MLANLERKYRREKTGDLDLSQVAAEVRAQVEKEAQAVLTAIKGLGSISGSASLSASGSGGEASISVSVGATPTPAPQRVYIGDPPPAPKASPGFGVLLGLGALAAVGLRRRR